MLSSMGYFNPQKIEQDIRPNPPMERLTSSGNSLSSPMTRSNYPEVGEDTMALLALSGSRLIILRAQRDAL